MTDAIRAAGKTWWGVERWLDYGERLHRIDWLCHAAVHLVGNTRGRVAPAIDAGLAVCNEVQVSLVTLEPIVDEHFGGYDSVPAPLRAFPQHWFDRPPLPERPFHTRPFLLSREEWIDVGNRVKDAWNLRVALSIEFDNTCRGKARAHHSASLRRIERKLMTFKRKMDSLVCGQHPDWADATRVFYGPNLIEVSST